VGAAVGFAVGDAVGAAVGDGVGVGVSHTLVSERQIPLSQSLWAWHCWPPMHGGQWLPPQSTSVSSPPCEPSLH
jgi:hypothetical protein